MFKHKVFISYASEDTEIAQRLYDDLKNVGVEFWLDRQSLTPGENWKLEIEKALKESTIFLALISSKSTTKEGFTQKELKRALEILDEKPEGDVFIIPVRVDDCPISVRLQDYQWIDLFPSYPDGLEKLLNVLKPDFVLKSQESWERHDGDINDNVVGDPYFDFEPKKEKPLWQKLTSSFRLITVALLLMIIFLSILLLVLVVIAPPVFCNGICIGMIILLVLIFAWIFWSDFKKQQIQENEINEA
jgi:hypothetical protein